MAFIPPNAEWYLAQIVLQYEIQEHTRSIIHVNTKLVRAASPEEAYDKAVKFGKAEESEYINTDQEKVKVRFRGLRDLLVIYEALADGAEIMYRELPDMDEAQVSALVTERSGLAVFSSQEAAL